MALTNSERQARYRQRLKDQAASGVTAEMVRRSARLLYRLVQEQAEEPEDWDGLLAQCRTRRGRDIWQQFIPDDVRPNAYDWVADPEERELLERVAEVMDAVTRPPTIKAGR